MKTTLNFSLLHENHQACYLFLSGKLYMIFLPEMWPILFFKSQRWRYYTLEANLDIITTQKSHCFCQAKTTLKRMQWWCSVSCKTKLLFSKTDMLHASKCDITILQHPPGRGFTPPNKWLFLQKTRKTRNAHQFSNEKRETARNWCSFVI